MKRKQIKDLLFEMGASAKLLEMPAVMERIYNYYIDYSEEELRKEINIGSNGEIECNSTKRSFCIAENGEVVFENYERDGIEANGRYFIDEFGMDREFVDNSLEIFEKVYSLERTLEGIKINGSKEVVEDQGDPILNYFNYTVLKKGFSKTMGFEGNRDFLTKHYPITRGWFEIREGIRTEDTEERIDQEYNSTEVESLKNRIKTIEEQHKSEMHTLKEEIDELKEEKELLQRMLKRTLDVCESVKRSPLGKIFFGRKLKELPEAPNTDER